MGVTNHLLNGSPSSKWSRHLGIMLNLALRGPLKKTERVVTVAAFPFGRRGYILERFFRKRFTYLEIEKPNKRPPQRVGGLVSDDLYDS